MSKSKDIRSRSGAGGSSPPGNPSSPFPQKTHDGAAKHNPTLDAHKSFTPKTPRGTNSPASGGGGKVTSVRPKV
ncbi:MAG: hypothetical protein H7Y88_02985 [Phycisphaerales bacterium]|nr:hypothetical protein [Phycisphaerales bacterium]